MIKLNCTFEGDILPSYKKEGDSGMDLHAWKIQIPYKGDLLPIQDIPEEGYILNPHERVLIKTGLKIEYTEDVDAMLRPRSGLSIKHGIIAQIGTLDNNYLGDTGIILLNTSNEPYTIHKGDRLGQIVFSKPVKVELNQTNKIDSKTERGETGFGDSGR